jgi:hypothetical protein
MGSFANPHSAADGAQADLAQADLAHADLAHTMASRIRGAVSDAEALRTLRAAFPDSPLAVRVAALATLAQRTEPALLHMPR